MLDMIEDQVTGADRVHMGVLHVAAPEEADPLAGQLETRFQRAFMLRSECGPVIGTRAGPGTVGAAFYVE